MMLQLIDQDGARIAAPEWDSVVADIDANDLAALHEDLTVVRRIDSEATALQRQGELALWPPLLGQEAAQVGSARALRADDFVFGTYREHGVGYCRGILPVDLLRVWRGTTASAWNPFDVGMAPAQVIIGAQALHATGYAMGIQADQLTVEGTPDSVAVAYLGDGAMSEGDVAEAMVFAASYQAPVVFFCQNNQYAISEPVALQTRIPLVERSAGFGIPSVQVDGNDALAVLAVTRAALQRARAGGGPTFIEAVTYRMGPHTTADDPARYRDAEEVAAWAGRDPIARLRLHLESLGVDGADLEARAGAVADRVAADLRAAVTAIADPEPLEVFAHVYAEPHHELERQRDGYAQYLEGFVE